MNEPPLSLDQLAGYFLEGCKKESELKVGVEWEKIGVYRETGKAVSYSGPCGVESIFKALMARYAWEPVFSGSHVIALRKGDSSITLEPGGQIELSGQKAAFLSENAVELDRHLEEVRAVSGPMGIVWLGLGVQPVSKTGEIEWVPKERYRIMREALKNNGALSHAMMQETAAIQISLDFMNEEDAVRKLRLAMALSPFLYALFANSPVSEGKRNGFYSRRSAIWLETAPERTGIIRKVFDDGFTIRDYVEYALDVPLFFIIRRGKWVPVENTTFRQFWRNGLDHYQATLADWRLHLSTLFTEARLRQYLEIRSVDCQGRDLGLSAPAFLKGLFYDRDAHRSAWELLGNLPWEERMRLRQEVPVKGLHASFKGAALWEVSQKLVVLAEEGLARLSAKQLAAKDEIKYLNPLKALLFEKHKMPAELLLEGFADDLPMEEKVRHIIQKTAL